MVMAEGIEALCGIDAGRQCGPGVSCVDMRVDISLNVCIGMCTDTCMETCVDVCVDMCITMWMAGQSCFARNPLTQMWNPNPRTYVCRHAHGHVCMDMRMGMCMDMCIGMCLGMCMEMCR